MVEPDPLDWAIARQIEAVRSAPPEDLERVRAAAWIIPELVGEMGLGECLGLMRVDQKPRLLLRFRVDQDRPLEDMSSEVVLKVYPDRPRGEGPLLVAWRDRGMNVPKLGFGERSGCSWLLLEYLELSSITPRSRIECLELTSELAAHGRTLHRAAPGLAPVLRLLDAVMLPRWDASANLLRDAGYDIPLEWHSRALAAYRNEGGFPLHGDLALTNLGRDHAGRLVVYDASALVGDRRFDAARWAVRLASQCVGPDELLGRWLEVEGLPFCDTASSLLGVECVLEAGSRHSFAERSGGSRRLRPNDEDAISRLVALAGELLA